MLAYWLKLYKVNGYLTFLFKKMCDLRWNAVSLMSIFFILNSNKIFKRAAKSVIQEGSKASSKLFLFL